MLLNINNKQIDLPITDLDWLENYENSLPKLTETVSKLKQAKDIKTIRVYIKDIISFLESILGEHISIIGNKNDYVEVAVTFGDLVREVRAKTEEQSKRIADVVSLA